MREDQSSLITSQVIAELDPVLLRLAMHSLRRREDAEDVVQETWFSALRAVATFEGRSSLRTWLTGIMRRRIVDRYRRLRLAEAFLEEESACLSHDVLERHSLRDAVWHVASALPELRPLEQTAVRLCDFEDFGRDEAARQMQITRAHLRVLLHRGRAKLALRLEAHGFRADMLG